MTSTWEHVVIDATDPGRLARWWAETLDYRIVREDAAETVVAPAPDARPRLVFVQAAPPAATSRETAGETKRARLHIELSPDDHVAEVERLVDRGARRVLAGGAEVVLADPEGNEFCVLSAR